MVEYGAYDGGAKSAAGGGNGSGAFAGAYAISWNAKNQISSPFNKICSIQCLIV